MIGSFFRSLHQHVPAPPTRRSKRLTAKSRASLVINLDRKAEIHPCLVLDSSKEGFRIRGNFHLRRGQLVELILSKEMNNGERCKVVWTGDAEHKGEVGLESC